MLVLSKLWKKTLQFILFFVSLIIIIGALQSLCSLLGFNIHKPKAANDVHTAVVPLLANLIGAVFTVWLFIRYVDKKKFSSIGFHSFSAKEFFWGLFSGFLLMVTMLFLLYFFNQVSIAGSVLNIQSILRNLVIFLAIAITEEVLIRGYVLSKMMQDMNKFKALIISSLLFSVLHALNPNVSIISLFNIFLAGILLGLPYIITQNLTYSIALHFSWNFFQTLFGSNDSGVRFYSLLIVHRQHDNIWNGGAFGFEGSIVCALSEIAAIVLMIMWYRKRQLAEVGV